MKITVRYFALTAEITGIDCENLDMQVGATAGDAVAAVQRRHPRLASADFRPLLAVNRRHVDPSAVLAAGDEVAIFPPVSGG